MARLRLDPAADATVAAATTFIQQTGGWVIAEGIENNTMLDGVLGSNRDTWTAPAIAGQGYLEASRV